MGTHRAAPRRHRDDRGLITFIGTLDGLFAAVAVDNATDGRHRTKREVVAHGIANVVSGLCGGVPVVLSKDVALASWNAGGRTRATTIISATVLLVALMFGDALISRIPVTAVAGLLVTLGIALVDSWTKGLAGRLRRKGALREQALLWSVATVLLVATRRGRLRIPAGDRRRVPALGPAVLPRHEPLARAQPRRRHGAAVAARVGRRGCRSASTRRASASA